MEVVVQLLLAKPAEGRATEVPAYRIVELFGTGVGAAVLPLIVVAVACIWSPNRTSRRMANNPFATSLLFIMLPVFSALTTAGVHQTTRN
jgi:hypothetical protein